MLRTAPYVCIGGSIFSTLIAGGQTWIINCAHRSGFVTTNSEKSYFPFKDGDRTADLQLSWHQQKFYLSGKPILNNQWKFFWVGNLLWLVCLSKRNQLAQRCRRIPSVRVTRRPFEQIPIRRALHITLFIGTSCTIAPLSST